MIKFLELEKQSNSMVEPSKINPSNYKEVDDDMTEPTASLERVPHVPYEVRTEGPLTYFHYYFEEAGSTVDGGTEILQPPSAKFLLNRYLVGAGVLTATALAGLALADMNKSQVSAKPNVPEPGVQQTAPKATDSTKRLNLIGTEVQPLQTNQPLWSHQSSPSVSKTPSAKQMASITIPQHGLKGEALKLPTSDQPDTLSTSLKPLYSSPVSLPRSIDGMSVSQRAKSVAKLGQTGLRPKPVVAQRLQSAEPQPLSAPQSLSNTSLPIESKNTSGSQAAGISSPETLAPQVTDASTRYQSPVPFAQTELPLTPLSVQPMTQDKLRLELFLREQAEKDLQNASNPVPSGKTATKDSVGGVNTHTVIPQSIQDLLDRSRPLPADKAVTVVPLTQKVAEDVLAMNKGRLATDKAGRFTILYFNFQDYRKAWLARSKVTQQLSLASAFPTYGFVDYQDRIIAVFDQQKSLRTSL